jgi:hypothetical protein
MSRSVVASIKVIFDVKEDVTPDAAKQQIEYAMNTACTFLEQSDVRDPKGAGVYYELDWTDELKL